MATISPERKATMLQTEAGGLMKNLSESKAYLQEQCACEGQAYVIHKAHDDPKANEKTTAVKLAVKTVVDYGFTLPPNLRFYCIGSDKVQNRAWIRDAGWNSISYITLGPSALEPGQLQSISNSLHPGYTKGSVTCIHEIGHALHAARLGEAFLDVNANGGVNGGPTGKNAVLVSGYAGQSKKEFVAEVFTGTLLGRKYAADVMKEYNDYQGPTLKP